MEASNDRLRDNFNQQSLVKGAKSEQSRSHPVKGHGIPSCQKMVSSEIENIFV